jgi:hypothetical protein
MGEGGRLPPFCWGRQDKRAHLRESGVAGWDAVAGACGRRKSVHGKGTGLRVRKRSGPQGSPERARRGDFVVAAAGTLWGAGAQDLSDATINDVAVHNAAGARAEWAAGVAGACEARGFCGGDSGEVMGRGRTGSE